MKYPFIGGIDDGCKVLLIKSGYGIAIEHPTVEITGVPEYGWDNRSFKNITGEYLANTYGKVESKEHAEFIIELGSSFPNWTGLVEEYPCWFCFDKDELFFFEKKRGASCLDERLITIPLPPKQIQTATSEEEFEMQQIMKNNGDNLVLGCEESKREEWPCVNDEVEYIGCKWKVAAKYKHMLMLVTPDDCGFAVAEIKEVKKPKTPEEELRDDIADIIDNASCSEQAAEYIVKTYLTLNTKKPQ